MNVDFEQMKRHSIGRIKSGINHKTLDHKTINFMYQQLPKWRDDPDRKIEESEDKLNLQLCTFLDSRARNDFPMVRFNHEEYQTGRRRVDLSASPVQTIFIRAKLHTIYDPILVIECKRLPAPSKNREKEYVTGGKERKSGGIQRFKLGLHGADLNLAAIIGYIQSGTGKEWHQNINKWISELANGKIKDDCVWQADERLKLTDEQTSEKISSYKSVHGRTNNHEGSTLTIYHLWVSMNQSPAPSSKL